MERELAHSRAFIFVSNNECIFHAMHHGMDSRCFLAFDLTYVDSYEMKYVA